MMITVNGNEITEAMIEAEMPFHSKHADPRDVAIQTLIMQSLLLDRAREIGLFTTSPENAVDGVLAFDVPRSTVAEEDLRALYEEHREELVQEESIEAEHILLTAENGLASEAQWQQAQDLIAHLKKEPHRFAEFAAAHSGCPSAQSGGALGAITRGQTVPPFERALFGLAEHSLHTEPVLTPFGLHIIRSGKKTAPGLMDYATARPLLEEALGDQARQDAIATYLEAMVAKATIEGYSFN